MDIDENNIDKMYDLDTPVPIEIQMQRLIRRNWYGVTLVIIGFTLGYYIGAAMVLVNMAKK